MVSDIDEAPEGWESRRLCPDGSCIGVIGPNGLCRECGTPAPEMELDPRRRGLRPDDEVDAELEEKRTSHATPTAPEDWDERALCPDGSCIGVIGDHGRCRECGSPAAPETPGDASEDPETAAD